MNAPTHEKHDLRALALKVTASEPRVSVARSASPTGPSRAVIEYQINISIEPTSHNTSEYMSTAEAARILGVCDREVRWKIQRGTLPAIEVGSRYLISTEMLAAYKHLREESLQRRKRPTDSGSGDEALPRNIHA